MQKTYCVNPSCAKPIEYAFSKPNFCPHCGNPLIPKLTTAPKPTFVSPYSPYSPSSAPAYQFSQEPHRVNPQREDPRIASIRRKMEGRRAETRDCDDDDDFEEESNAHIDFDNFNLAASVRVPQQPKMTLGDFVSDEVKNRPAPAPTKRKSVKKK